MSLKIPSAVLIVTIALGLAGLPGFADAIDTEISSMSITQSDDLSLAEQEAWAQELFNKITNNIHESDRNLASEFALKLALAGQPNWAEQLFEQTIEAQRNAKESPSSELLIHMAQAGLSDRTLELVEQINVGPYRTGLERSKALNAIAQALIDAGRLGEAEILIQQAVALAQAADHYSLSYSSNGSCGNEQFSALIDISETLSQLELAAALEIVDSIYSCSGVASPDLMVASYREWAFMGIVRQLDEPQAVTQVWRATQTQLTPFEQARVWGAIAAAYWEQGQVER
ncbi:MAG: hypothetical protein F6J87_17240 [Spirulina sp. SIO3F2]|nr:hypothetical protein [Spirulina sp. SIO3F2]